MRPGQLAEGRIGFESAPRIIVRPPAGTRSPGRTVRCPASARCTRTVSRPWDARRLLMAREVGRGPDLVIAAADQEHLGDVLDANGRLFEHFRARGTE